MTRTLAVLIACAVCIPCIPLMGCGDGVGVPIRRAPLERDAEADRDADADDDASTEERSRGSSDDFNEAHCAEALDWPASYAQAEDELLEAIGELRQGRIRCGDRELDNLPPLRLSPALRCSARLHSLDMVRRDFTGRTNPDGDGPRDRMRAAGFRADETDESIASQESEPASLLESLLEDWDDCMNVATTELTHIGIGRYEGRWTLDFARE